MGFWAWLTGSDTATPTDITPNTNPPGVPPTVGPLDYVPGDPDGVEFTGELVEGRALPAIYPSPWNGWPAEWQMPYWSSVAPSLVDTAWMCLDRNASILSTLPVYKTRGGQVVDPETWMTNPDPRVYTSWSEFAKQLFWDYQGCGEVFVLASDYFTSGWPMFMRVIPPPMVTVEMDGAMRRYWIGSVEITDDVLHIRYKSKVGSARGEGPLDVASARTIASAVLARYVQNMTIVSPASQTLETDQLLNEETAQRISDQWADARLANLGRPPVLDANIKLVDHTINAREMALLELAQFTDARIAAMLVGHPGIVGIPTGESMTYKNIEQLFEFHDRSILHPIASDVMAALSGWALPRGQNVEIDRDQYARPSLTERVDAYTGLAALGAIMPEEIRALERALYLTPNPGPSLPAQLPVGGSADE